MFYIWKGTYALPEDLGVETAVRPHEQPTIRLGGDLQES